MTGSVMKMPPMILSERLPRSCPYWLTKATVPVPPTPMKKPSTSSGICVMYEE
jgi:hypothetical protein